MGVAASPHCSSGIFCDALNYIIDHIIYFKAIQDLIGPAGYFRDPNHMDVYLNDSVFLPYLNNEKEMDQTIKERFTSLNAAMFVMFTEDTMIYPKETAWFYDITKDKTLVPVKETQFYQ